MKKKDLNMLRRIIAVLCCLAVTSSIGFVHANEDDSLYSDDVDPQFEQDNNWDKQSDSINSEKTEQGEVKNSAAIYYKFTKKSQKNNDTSAKVLKVSPDLTGTGSFQTTFSKSTTRVINISVASSAESKIKATISGGYGATLSSGVGITVNKTKAKKGYLAFQPYRRVIKGTLKTYNSAYQNINGGLIKTQSITAKYPQRLSNGQADGNYYVHYY